MEDFVLLQTLAAGASSMGELLMIPNVSRPKLERRLRRFYGLQIQRTLVASLSTRQPTRLASPFMIATALSMRRFRRE